MTHEEHMTHAEHLDGRTWTHATERLPPSHGVTSMISTKSVTIR